MTLLFSAAYDNNVMHLPDATLTRFEILVTFGNHPSGGPRHTDETVDINGNGVIDADEHQVRSVTQLIEKVVPATQAANAAVTLADAPASIRTEGTVTFTNPIIHDGATTGTIVVTYDAGASGGTITSCQPRPVSASPIPSQGTRSSSRRRSRCQRATRRPSGSQPARPACRAAAGTTAI